MKDEKKKGEATPLLFSSFILDPLSLSIFEEMISCNPTAITKQFNTLTAESNFATTT